MGNEKIFIGANVTSTTVLVCYRWLTIRPKGIGLGTSIHGRSFFYSFNRNWSKFGTLLQKDANEVETKKIIQNFCLFGGCPLFLKNRLS
jgi:hypothetical protein